jgi:hypothetical protein
VGSQNDDFASAQAPVVKDSEGRAGYTLVDLEDQIIEVVIRRELGVLGLMAKGLKYVGIGD